MVSNAELYDLFAKDPAACFTDLKDPTVPSSLDDMVPPPYLINGNVLKTVIYHWPKIPEGKTVEWHDQIEYLRLNGLSFKPLIENLHIDYVVRTGTKPWPLDRYSTGVFLVSKEMLDVLEEHSDADTYETFPVKVGIITKKGERISEDADYHALSFKKYCFTYHPYTSTLGPTSTEEFKSKKYNAPLHALWTYDVAPHWHYYDFRGLDVWCVPCSYRNHLFVSEKVFQIFKKKKWIKKDSYRRQSWVFPDGTGYDGQRGLLTEGKIKIPPGGTHPLDPRSEASTYYRRYLETYGHIRGFV